jgi:hypothetical protein
MALKWRDGKKMARNWRETGEIIAKNKENGEKAASVFLGEQDGRDLPACLGDDVEASASRGPVTTQQAGAIDEGILVRLLVFGAEFLAPIAAMVTAEVG